MSYLKNAISWQIRSIFLGITVGNSGIHLDPKDVEIQQNLPKSRRVAKVRRFIRFLLFFRRFIQNFNKISVQLTTSSTKDMGIQKWSSKCDELHSELEKALTSPPILVLLNWKRQLRGHFDASQIAIRDTLTPVDNNGTDWVISLLWRKLNSAEQNYTAYDREPLRFVYPLQRFKQYLEGLSFEVLVDNQMLKHFFSQADMSRREAWWLETLGNIGIFSIDLKLGKYMFLEIHFQELHILLLVRLNI